MDHAVPRIVDIEQRHAEIPAVLLQGLDLDPGLVVDIVTPGVGRDVVIDHCESRLRAANLAPGHAQPLEGLRAGHLVDEMAVDIDQAGSVFLPVDDMGVPYLVEERPRLCHGIPVLIPSIRCSGA